MTQGDEEAETEPGPLAHMRDSALRSREQAIEAREQALAETQKTGIPSRNQLAELAQAYAEVGVRYEAAADWDSASAAFGRLTEVLELLSEQEELEWWEKANLASAYEALARSRHQLTGDLEEFTKHSLKGMAIREELAEAGQGSEEEKHRLHTRAAALGTAYHMQRDWPAAAAYLARAIEVRQDLRASGDADEVAADLAPLYDLLGVAKAQQGELAEADEALEAARAIRETGGVEQAAGEWAWNELADAWVKEGLSQKALGDFVGLADSFTRAAAIREATGSRSGPVADQRHLALIYGTLGAGAMAQDEAETAEEHVLRALSLRGDIAASNPSDSEPQVDLAHDLAYLASIRLTRREPEQALAPLLRAREILENLVRQDVEENSSAGSTLEIVLGMLGRTLKRLDRHAEAEEVLGALRDLKE